MNTFLLVVLVLEAVFGIGFTLAPAFMMATFSVTLDATSATMGRMLGTALIGLAVLAFFSRRVDVRSKPGLIFGLLMYYVLSAIIMIFAITGSLMSALGWIMVILHIGLTVWGGYFVIRAPGMASIKEQP